ncbi:hypothetical protein Tco_1430163 [Tanacetum coccineum]
MISRWFYANEDVIERACLFRRYGHVCVLQLPCWSGDLDNSTSNVLIPLDSWTSGLLVYKLPLSEKARRHDKVYNWETATYGKIWDNEDVHDLRSVETEFPAIVFNETLTSEAALSCEPTVSSLNNDEIDFRISFDESDDEDCTDLVKENLTNIGGEFTKSEDPEVLES